MEKGTTLFNSISDYGQPGVINAFVQIPDMFTCIKVIYSSMPTMTSAEPLANWGTLSLISLNQLLSTTIPLSSMNTSVLIHHC